MSSFRVSVGESSGTFASSRNMANPPSGRFTAKIARHTESSNAESTRPPTTGPSAVVSAEAAAQMPIARPRSAFG